MRLCEDYTQCSLTYDKDKMPAIAGMIRHLQKWHSVVFNAGIWLEFITESLLWYRLYAKALRPLEDVNFPSWTWASYEGAVRYLQPTAGEGRFKPARSLSLTLRKDSESSPPLSTPMKLMATVRKLSSFATIDPYPEFEVDPDLFNVQHLILDPNSDKIGCIFLDNPDDDCRDIECVVVCRRIFKDFEFDNTPSESSASQSVTSYSADVEPTGAIGAVGGGDSYNNESCRTSSPTHPLNLCEGISADMVQGESSTGDAMDKRESANHDDATSMRDKGIHPTEHQQDPNAPNQIAGENIKQDGQPDATANQKNIFHVYGDRSHETICDGPGPVPVRSRPRRTKPRSRPPPPPGLPSWGYEPEYWWHKEYCILFVRSTGLEKSEYRRVGVGALDDGWLGDDAGYFEII